MIKGKFFHCNRESPNIFTPKDKTSFTVDDNLQRTWRSIRNNYSHTRSHRFKQSIRHTLKTGWQNKDGR